MLKKGGLLFLQCSSFSTIAYRYEECWLLGMGVSYTLMVVIRVQARSLLGLAPTSCIDILVVCQLFSFLSYDIPIDLLLLIYYLLYTTMSGSINLFTLFINLGSISSF
jgi:hypothetical protein